MSLFDENDNQTRPDGGVLSDIEQPYHEKPLSTQEVEPPPDGGLTAWLQVFLLHLVFFNTWGVANSFGVFQEYYSTNLHESRSSISWIGSAQVFFLFSIGVMTGRLTDAGHFKPIFALGVALQLVGIFMTSLCTTYWQTFLSQAVCLGLGNGCTFCPALSVTSSYFREKRGFAVGLAAAGAGTGGLVYPVVANQLLYHNAVGFPWTLRVMGFIMLATYLPCLIWFTPRLPPHSAGAWLDVSAFKELPFIFFSISMFFNFWGLYFAFFYLGTFARDQLAVPEPINLLITLNGVGIVGRIAPGIIADWWTGLLNTLVPLCLIASLLIYCWHAIHSDSTLYIFAVLYGLAASAIQSVFPAAATTMTPDIKRTGTRVGMIFTTVSFAALTGPAICGALIQTCHGDYLGAQIFAGTSILLGGFFSGCARFAKTGFRLKIKI